MPSFVSVSRATHIGKAWLRYTSYSFAADRALISVTAAELAKAVLAMPLAFVEENGGIYLVAVTSLEPGKNQFVAHDGRWLGAYVPAAVRGHPFALLQPDGAQAAILCVDEDSGLVVDAGTTDSEPFFDVEGGPAPFLKALLDFLGKVEASRVATSHAVTALSAAGLLTPWLLQVDSPEGQKTVTGLLRIDETRLNALDDVSFLALRSAGALAVAYAQILSMGQIGIFETLAKLQAQISEVHARQQAAFDSSFNRPEAEGLQFNFSLLGGVDSSDSRI
jgi:hypothetical protein